MLREIGSVFSFLTIFPANTASLETIARFMYIFPIVGMAIGLVVGSIGFGLSMFLEPLVVSLVLVALLVVITGLHHTDGLADFADGLMTKGDKEKKLASMKDINAGSAGITALILYLVGLVIAISLSTGYQLFLAILLSEIFAKFSMVLMASVGKSATLGTNSPFVELMKNPKKIILAGAITIIPLAVLGGTAGMIIFGAGIALTLFITAFSHRSFGGITGDVLGATNELTRLSSLLIFVSI